MNCRFASAVFAMAVVAASCGDTSQATGFRGALPSELVTTDPHEGVDIAAEYINPLVFENLVGLDSTGDWVGLLAESWEVSEDGRAWTFDLRDNVTFHDGSDLDGTDVVATFERILDPDGSAAQRSVLDVVESVVATDANVVQFNLDRPTGNFLSLIGLGARTGIVPSEVVGTDGTLLEIVGTGPFKFVSWGIGEPWIGERFDGYWGPQSRVSEVSFVAVPDDQARLLAVRSADVDWTINPARDALDGDLQNARVVNIFENHAFRINFNSTRNPLDDIHLRQAIAYAIDKGDINEAVFGGTGVVSNQPFLETSALHLPVDDIYVESNLQLAREALDRSDYDGTPLVVIHPNGFLPGLWELVQSQLSEIGIVLEVQLVEVAEYIERSQAFDYDMSANEQSSIYHWDRVFEYFGADSASNWLIGGYASDSLDGQLQSAREIDDPGRASEAYASILDQLQAEAAVLFVLSLPTIQLVGPEFADLKPNPVDGGLVYVDGGLTDLK